MEVRWSRDTAFEAMLAELRQLRTVPGVLGALVATQDGYSLCCDLEQPDADIAAAITAASLGLAGRLSDLTGSGNGLHELQARSDTGYVCLYAIGNHWLLAVITDLTVNLALLKLDARDVIKKLTAVESQVEVSPWADVDSLATRR